MNEQPILRARKQFATVAFTTTPTGSVPKRAMLKILRSGHVRLYRDIGNSYVRAPSPAMLAFYVATGVRTWIDEDDDVKRLHVSWAKRDLWMLLEQDEQDDGLDARHRDVLLADTPQAQDRIVRSHIRAIEDLQVLEYIDRGEGPLMWELTPAGIAKRKEVCATIVREKIRTDVMQARRNLFTVIDGGRT